MRFLLRIKKLFNLSLNSRFISALIFNRVAASTEHQRMLRSLLVRSVIDVGANRGQFALAVRSTFPSASIYSFEPLKTPASTYRSVFARDERAVLREIAIGAESGTATIHRSERDDSSSLLPITKLQEALFPGTSEAGVEIVQVEPLHAVLASSNLIAPCLLKLDVQGFELEALKGCEQLFAHIEYVYVECSFVELYQGQALVDAVIAWLNDRGYLLKDIQNISYDHKGSAVQADFLFARSSVDRGGGTVSESTVV